MFCEHLYGTKLHWVIGPDVLFIVHVVFVGRLVCSVHMLYMELSYIGSLDRSTRASEHVQFTRKVTRMAGFYNRLIVWKTVYYACVFVGRLVCSVHVLYMELSYIGSLDRLTRALEHVTVQISMPVRLRLVLLIVSL